AARRAPQGRRQDAVLRRVLERAERDRAWPCRPARRPALDLARALRRQGANAADLGRAQFFRAPPVGRRFAASARRPARPRRRADLSAGSARAVVEVWTIAFSAHPRESGGPEPQKPSQLS